MGLGLEVGILDDLKQHVEEGYLYFRSQFAKINEVLKANNQTLHFEPDTIDSGVWTGDMISYSGLHYVRRLAAYIYYDKPLPSPARERLRAVEDTILQKLQHEFSESSAGEHVHQHPLLETAFLHLVYHSDSEGYYLPIDFKDVIVASRDVDGYIIGSSHRLKDECAFLAEKIDLPLDDANIDIISFAVKPNEDVSAPLWQRYGREAFGIYQLYHGASASIEKKAALVFC